MPIAHRLIVWFVIQRCFPLRERVKCALVKSRLAQELPKQRTHKNNQSIQMSTTTNAADLQHEVAELMIESLNLEVTSDQITPDAPLYGEGLGLDSIDVLEVALVVSKRYGLQLRADSADNQHIFSSLRSLTEHIAAHRTK